MEIEWSDQSGLNIPVQQLYAAPAGWKTATWDAQKIELTEDIDAPERYFGTVPDDSSIWLIYKDNGTPSYNSWVGYVSVSSAMLQSIKAKTDLITVGGITYSGPVDPTGKLRATIIIGDDYLAANGRAFKWTVPAINGITPATAISRFAGAHSEGLAYSWNVTGTVTDLSNGQWELSHDMSRGVSGALIPGGYDWSVEITAANSNEVTPVRSGQHAIAARKFS
jgi:hypothetical protein